MSRRFIGDAAVWVMPFVAGLAFYGWMQWHPWTQESCNAPVWTAVTWIPFVVVPPMFVGIRLRLAAKSWKTTVALILLAVVLTALVCFWAWGASIVANHCGE